MNRLIERCAMLDIHKSQITACVRVPDDHGGRRQEMAEFSTTTAGLMTLADWLRSFAVTVVGMESTGVYWRAAFYLLEDEFECRLDNARHLRHVPGRKSDVQDAQWGCQLVEHGLVRASFVPPRPLRELRDLVRYRKAKIQERTREVWRVEKTLQDAGIKLSSVASKVLGVSARKMLDAMISGTHDPDVLAELAKGTLRKKIPALREALEGRFTGHHALLVSHMLAQIDFLDETIATLSEQIEELTRPFSRELELLDTIAPRALFSIQQRPRGHRWDCCLRTHAVRAGPSLRITGIPPVAGCRADFAARRIGRLHRRTGAVAVSDLGNCASTWRPAPVSRSLHVRCSARSVDA